MVSGSRRRARAYALQVLYALDLNAEVAVGVAIDTYWEQFAVELDEPSRAFARELVASTLQRRDEIDDVIQAASKNWRVERMSRVDRNILRLATYELRFAENVPIKVVINEAVELAKRFGADDSPAFVNGVLDRIAQPVAPGRT